MKCVTLNTIFEYMSIFLIRKSFFQIYLIEWTRERGVRRYQRILCILWRYWAHRVKTQEGMARVHQRTDITSVLCVHYEREHCNPQSFLSEACVSLVSIPHDKRYNMQYFLEETWWTLQYIASRSFSSNALYFSSFADFFIFLDPPFRLLQSRISIGNNAIRRDIPIAVYDDWAFAQRH